MTVPCVTYKDTTEGPLPFPVVIPQQRPGSQDRGFMAAYAPCLEYCGIDQHSFLQFIDETNTALQGNKILAGVQVVSFGVGFTPEIITTAVATGVQFGANLANKAHVKHKTNAILEKYNNEFFGPRGLYCMLMKYEPDVRDPTLPRSESRFAKLGSAFGSPISGTSEGVHSLPLDTAPLMYIDERRQHKAMLSGPPPSYEATYSSDSSDGARSPGSQNGKQKMSLKEKSKKAFDSFNDYLDRRARVQYATENPGDIFNTPQNRPFSNRYLDPNHPATNGGLIGLISGGALSPDPETKLRRKMERINEEERRVLDEYHQRIDSVHSQRQSYNETQRQLGYIERDYAPRLATFREERRKLENGGDRHIKDVLYLMIVNKPSDAQLAVATAQLDEGYGYQPVKATFAKS